MNNAQKQEQDELQKYLEAKAKQEQEQEMKKEPEQLSAYEACVLRESARIHELMAEAQRKGKELSEDK